MDLRTTDGRYDVTFELELTNRAAEPVDVTPVTHDGVRVEYLRHEGRAVPQTRSVAKDCIHTHGCIYVCRAPRRRTIAPGETVRFSVGLLSFTYCDREQTDVEFHPPGLGRYAVRFRYRDNGMTAVSNEVTFELRGR